MVGRHVLQGRDYEPLYARFYQTLILALLILQLPELTCSTAYLFTNTEHVEAGMSGEADQRYHHFDRAKIRGKLLLRMTHEQEHNNPHIRLKF